jgi:hypothetical protein
MQPRRLLALSGTPLLGGGLTSDAPHLSGDGFTPAFSRFLGRFLGRRLDGFRRVLLQMDLIVFDRGTDEIFQRALIDLLSPSKKSISRRMLTPRPALKSWSGSANFAPCAPSPSPCGHW